MIPRILMGGLIILISICTAGEVVDTAFLSVTARAEGLGNAVVASPIGLGALYINPVQLMTTHSAECITSTGKMFDDYTRIALGFSRKVDERLVLGCTYASAEIIGIPRVEKMGERPDVLYETSAQRLVFMGAGAYQLTEACVVGTTLKYYSYALFEESATALSVDIGTRYSLLPGLNVGGAIRNINSPQVLWTTKHADTLGREYQYGVAYETRILWFKTLANADQIVTTVTRPYLNLGVETWLLDDVFALRIGRNNGTFAVGAGLALFNADLQYVYSDHEDLGTSHRVSLGATW